MTKEEVLNIVRKGENKRVKFKQAIDRPERMPKKSSLLPIWKAG
jgi:hypothetical protein